MNLSKLLLVGLAAAAVAGCDEDGDLGVVDPGQNLAFIRYINAVNDTGALAFRIVDEPVENLPTFVNVAFRGVSSAGYQGITAGDRQVRVFPVSTNPAVASQRLIDQTIPFEAGQHYTLLHAGSARAADGDPAADRLLVIEDEFPAPGAGNIALRAINAMIGSGAVDLFVGVSNTDPIAAPVASVAAVDYGAASAYTTLPVRPAPPAADTLYKFSFTPTGDPGTVIGTGEPNRAGVAATATTTAQGGVRIENSVLTAVTFAASPDGSVPFATAANRTPAVGLFIDRP
jgi:hypothetical protein